MHAYLTHYFSFIVCVWCANSVRMMLFSFIRSVFLVSCLPRSHFKASQEHMLSSKMPYFGQILMYSSKKRWSCHSGFWFCFLSFILSHGLWLFCILFMYLFNKYYTWVLTTLASSGQFITDPNWKIQSKMAYSINQSINRNVKHLFMASLLFLLILWVRHLNKSWTNVIIVS